MHESPNLLIFNGCPQALIRGLLVASPGTPIKEPINTPARNLISERRDVLTWVTLKQFGGHRDRDCRASSVRA